MSIPELKICGCFAIRDSGVPHSTASYTTLVIFHGFGWHSAIFSKFFPVVSDLNIRLVAVNRRDYPGSSPLSDKERKLLDDIADISDREEAAKALRGYTKAEARRVYDFLVKYVSEESIPVEGGIIIVGWSFGAATILGLIASIENFVDNEVHLRPYIKYAVLYDPPYHTLGYPPHAEGYNPLFDPVLAPGEGPRIFPGWISGYFAHGPDMTTTTLEFRDAMSEPVPTILSMDPSDVQLCLELGPTLPGGSDDRLVNLGIKLGVFAQIRGEVLFLSDKKLAANEDSKAEQVAKQWNDLELHYVWCDHSNWEVIWGKLCLEDELKTGMQEGKRVRKVKLERLKGGNHFYHWDKPDLAIKALLSGIHM